MIANLNVIMLRTTSFRCKTAALEQEILDVVCSESSSIQGDRIFLFIFVCKMDDLAYQYCLAKVVEIILDCTGIS